MAPSIGPKPTRPATELIRDRTVQLRVQQWVTYDDGGVWLYDDHVEDRGVRLSKSNVVGRTRNKVISLSSGTKWKPNTGYQFFGYLVRRESGEVVFTHYRHGKPTFKATGPNYGDPVKLFSKFQQGNGSPRNMPSNTKARLDTEVMNKVGDRKASHGESIGEAKQTANHIARTASDLAKAYLMARKGNWKGVANALKVNPRKHPPNQSAGERWLEYQYGWKPMMADIYDNGNLLLKGFREKKMIMSSVRRLTEHEDARSDSQRIDQEPWHVTASCVDFAKVFYSIDDNFVSRINQVGLLNPLEIAWALTPYSFVVDWFLPVGNMLQALTDRVGVTFIDGCYGTWVESSVRQLPNPYGSKYQSPMTSNSQWVTVDSLAYDRTKMTGFPWPSPYIKNPFSSTHILSAMALIGQLGKLR